MGKIARGNRRSKSGSVRARRAYFERLEFRNMLLAAPMLLTPSDGLTGLSITPTFSWSSVSGATSGYRIVVSTVQSELPTDPGYAGSPAPLHGFTAPSASTSYTPTTTLSPVTKYYWEVHGGSPGVGGDWSQVHSFTTGIPAPTNLKAAATGPHSVSLTWDDVISAGDYFVERSFTSATSGFNQIAIPAQDQPYYTDSGNQLSPNNTYWYRVRADTGGVFSEYSSVAVVTTPNVATSGLGKGDWIWYMDQTEIAIGVSTVQGVIDYEKNKGMQWITVKAGDGNNFAGWSQFNTDLVTRAHTAGLKIYAWVYAYGGGSSPINPSTVAGEIAVANNALSLGADGLIIDAEAEYEGLGTSAATSAATQYCQGIRASYPNTFLAYAPFPVISLHPGFPYVAFGKYTDAVMPQDYWASIGNSPAEMVARMDTEWTAAQNSWAASGHADSIKPIIPLGQGFSPVTGSDVTAFVNALKNDPNPATAGGYQGVSFWSAQHHTLDIWNAIGTITIGNVNRIVVGDFNRDGHVSATDIPAMMSALADLNAYKSINGLSDADLTTIADTNLDGQITNADLQALLNLLKNGNGSGAGSGGGSGEVAAPQNDAVVVGMQGLQFGIAGPVTIASEAPRKWQGLQPAGLQRRGLMDVAISSRRILPDGVDRLLGTSSIHRSRRLFGPSPMDAGSDGSHGDLVDEMLAEWIQA
jgi:hypothetical protein